MNAGLAKDFYIFLFKATTSFELKDIGSDGLYALGAILTDGTCDFEKSRTIVKLLQYGFASDHPLWRYVKIVEPTMSTEAEISPFIRPRTAAILKSMVVSGSSEALSVADALATISSNAIAANTEMASDEFLCLCAGNIIAAARSFIKRVNENKKPPPLQEVIAGILATSGESLLDDKGVDLKVCNQLADEIFEALELRVEPRVLIVVSGGTIQNVLTDGRITCKIKDFDNIRAGDAAKYLADADNYFDPYEQVSPAELDVQARLDVKA